MLKKLSFMILCIGTLILLVSCPAPPAIMGGEAMVFNGHFLFDQSYDTGEWESIYRADGTYELIGKVWNASSETWTQNRGARGTYMYEPSTHLMTRTSTEQWEWEGETGWVVLADYYAENEPDITSWSMVETFPSYFTSNGNFDVYTAAGGNSWEFVYHSMFSETEAGTTQTSEFKATITYTLSNSELLYEQENEQKDFGDAEFLPNYQRQWGGATYRLAPTGTAWSVGNTVTFYYTEEVNRARNWDDNAGDWGAWNDWQYTTIRDRTFTHMGDYMLAVTATSGKGLE